MSDDLTTNALGTKDGTSVVTPTALKEAVERVTLTDRLREKITIWNPIKEVEQKRLRNPDGHEAAKRIEILEAVIASQSETLEAMASALEAIQTEAERENGRWVHMKRVIAIQARTTLTQYRKTGEQ